MASKELIIDDDFCRDMGNYFVSQGERLDELVSEYTTILGEVKDKGIVSGNVADALASYIEYANVLKNKTGVISTRISNSINSFLKAVDSADKYLF